MERITTRIMKTYWGAGATCAGLVVSACGFDEPGDASEAPVGAVTSRLTIAPESARLTLSNPRPSPGDRFGWAIATTDELIAVSSINETRALPDEGVVYLFDAESGQLLQTLASAMPSEFGRFGTALAICGGKIVVGAPGDDLGFADAGGAYVFDGDRGSPTFGALLSSLVSPDPNQTQFGQFGSVVACAEDHLLVGSHRATYLYAPTGALVRQFPAGSGIAGTANRVIVGNFGEGASGAARFFDRFTGVQVGSFTSPPPGAGRFRAPSRIVTAGDSTLIADVLHDSTAGAGFLLQASTASLQATLNNPNPGIQRLGISLSLRGDGEEALMATLPISPGLQPVYHYSFASGSPQLLNVYSSGLISDGFGGAVAFRGNEIVISAYDAASSAGEAYVFGSESTADLSVGLVRVTQSVEEPVDVNGDGRQDLVARKPTLIAADLILIDASDLSGQAVEIEVSFGSERWTVSIDVPADVGTSASLPIRHVISPDQGGDHVLQLKVDPQDLIEEMDEDNNTLPAALELTVKPGVPLDVAYVPIHCLGAATPGFMETATLGAEAASAMLPVAPASSSATLFQAPYMHCDGRLESELEDRRRIRAEYDNTTAPEREAELRAEYLRYVQIESGLVWTWAQRAWHQAAAGSVRRVVGIVDERWFDVAL